MASLLTPGMIRSRPADHSAADRAGVITFDRTRNTDGEFSPQSDDAPDPAVMRAAYGHQTSGLAKAGKVAGAAAGLGGTAAAALLLARKLKGRRA